MNFLFLLFIGIISCSFTNSPSGISSPPLSRDGIRIFSPTIMRKKIEIVSTFIPISNASTTTTNGPPPGFADTLAHHFSPPPGFAVTLAHHFSPPPGFAATLAHHYSPPPGFAVTLAHHFSPPPGFAATLAHHYSPPPGFESKAQSIIEGRLVNSAIFLLKNNFPIQDVYHVLEAFLHCPSITALKMNHLFPLLDLIIIQKKVYQHHRQESDCINFMIFRILENMFMSCGDSLDGFRLFKFWIIHQQPPHASRFFPDPFFLLSHLLSLPNQCTPLLYISGLIGLLKAFPLMISESEGLKFLKTCCELNFHPAIILMSRTDLMDEIFSSSMDIRSLLIYYHSFHLRSIRDVDNPSCFNI